MAHHRGSVQRFPAGARRVPATARRGVCDLPAVAEVYDRRAGRCRADQPRASDHCADLSTLLRARALGRRPAAGPAGPCAGPFTVDTRLLPHWVPNAGARVSAGGTCVDLHRRQRPEPGRRRPGRGRRLADRRGDLPLPGPSRRCPFLTSARQAGHQAAQAGVARLLLTHLWPGTHPAGTLDAASQTFSGHTTIAETGVILDL
jgi:hypothetical protein